MRQMADAEDAAALARDAEERSNSKSKTKRPLLLQRSSASAVAAVARMTADRR